MKKSQKQFVKKQLLETGKISRNDCIRNHYITRLGAIICDLNKDGYEIEGNKEGNDYVYRIKNVKEKVVEYIDKDTVRIKYVDKVY